jgi:hypothetical protein
MRVESSISLQRVGYTPGGLGVWPPRVVQPQRRIERRTAARALPPQRLGDAAQLTLLMAQSLAGDRELDVRMARRAYAEPEDHDAIFTLRA